MIYRVTTHAGPLHGRAHIETFDRRADAEQYASRARAETPDATVHVTGQHEAPPVDLERAREWMTHLAAVWAAAPSVVDHKHANGWEQCPICGRVR